MANKDKRSSLPKVLALGALTLLILLLGLYFENCLKKNVLGVSTFNSSSSKNPVTDGETFNFAATIVGDQAGALNATVLFNLTGSGVINSNIQGPGTCLKLTDTTAACNNVNIDPNETLLWTVPVTAGASCSPGNISLQTRLVATVVTSTSTASVNCVASQPTQNNGTQPTGSTTGNQTKTTTTSKTTTTAKATPSPVSSLDLTGLACTRVNGFPLVFILFILWLLASAYYFIFRKR